MENEEFCDCVICQLNRTGLSQEKINDIVEKADLFVVTGSTSSNLNKNE